MNSDYALAEAGESLRNLLIREIKIDREQVEFLTPHEPAFNGSQTKLALLLYQVEPNGHLNHDPVSTGPQADDKLYKAPLYVDLHFLLSVRTQPGEAREGLQLLGQAMRVLYDYPNLTGSLLAGSLAQIPGGLQIRQESLSMTELHRIWSASGIPPMFPALHYVVSPVPLYSLVAMPVQRVTQKISKYAVLGNWP